MSRRDLPDPEVEWRRVVRLRLQWATMIYGSWKAATVRQLVTDPSFREPEEYGPPMPRS